MIIKSIKSIFKILFLIIILVLAYGGYFFYRLYWPFIPSAEVENFIIEEGSGVNPISRDLYEREFIKDKFVFETYLWLLKSEGKLQAGEHHLPREINIKQLAERLILGQDLSKERIITFIEGWNLRDIGAMFEKKGIASVEQLYALSGRPASFSENIFDFSAEYDFLNSKPKNVNLEGYLYPDTYRVYKDASAKDILRKALDNFDKKLNSELRQEIIKQGKTIHQVIILASIIEKEARAEDERKMIADIFWRRLRAGIPLQADSTVNYITGGNRPSVTYEELRLASPYNSYKYRGLPPGPISNPSLEAIRAAVYPTSNEYWFFLTASDDGRVIYARSNEEHNINRRRYLP